MMEKFNRYTSIQAKQQVADGARDPRALALFTSPLRSFWSNYLRTGGWRDGVAGTIVALARVAYQFLLTAKLWDERRLAERLEAAQRLAPAGAGRLRRGGRLAVELPEPPA